MRTHLLRLRRGDRRGRHDELRLVPRQHRLVLGADREAAVK
ncbi:MULTISPECIES: hypothetical protein [unclassified Streptomyces]|nr:MULTISPECIES: hypothetical protein [unclassified Streptomyces]